MAKKTQKIIVLIFFVIGILFITGIYLYNIFEIQKISEIVTDVGLKQNIDNVVNKYKISLVISIVIFTAITVIVGLFTFKIMTRPINRLIETVIAINNL